MNKHTIPDISPQFLYSGVLMTACTVLHTSLHKCMVEMLASQYSYVKQNCRHSQPRHVDRITTMSEATFMHKGACKMRPYLGAFRVHKRHGLAPVALPGKQPVPQLVVHLHIQPRVVSRA